MGGERMAVSMNANSMRADIMISDAMLPQRIEEIAEEQAGMFAKLLDDIGSANGDLAVQISETVDKYSDMKAAGEAAIYRDKETGRILPEDPKKLVKMILKGEVRIENVPEELITPEFIRLLMLMSKAEELDEDDDEKSLFDPTDAIAAEQNFQQELSNSMLMELYQIIEKHNERESEDKVTMLDGISEPIDETRTIPSPLTAENDRAADEGVFTQIIDNLVENVSESTDVVEETTLDATVKSNAVMAAESGVANENVAETSAITDITDIAKTVETLGVNATAEVSAITGADETGEISVADMVFGKTENIDAGTDRAIPQEAAANGSEQSMESQVTVGASGEQTITDQAAVSQNEQSAETAAQQNIPVEKFTVKAEKTEAKPEVAENAVKTDNDWDQVTVKNVTRNENAGKLDKTVSEEPKAVTVGHERVKSAAEEFEMLKNAKAKAAAKPVEEKPEVKTGNTAQPLNADSPIVFKRADGSEIEVRPSTIVNQAAKLIEKAVTENDDKTEYSLVLNPEELGRITVKLTKAADGAVSITIAAENARTQRILEQHSDVMQSNLRSSGVNLESWQTVNERQQETAAQDYNGSSKNPYYRHDSDRSEENPDGESFADIIASM